MSSFFRAFCLLFIFAACLGSANAHAAGADANAQRLKSIFENFLTYQKNLAQLNGSSGLQYDGEIMVEPAGSYYAVTLPHVKMVYPDRSRLDIGMISINASPATVPGQWKMAVAMPTPMTITDAQNRQIAKITIGTQKTAGIWNEKLQGFSQYDAQYTGISATTTQNDITVQIPDIRTVFNAKPDDAGKWTGGGFLDVKGLAVTWAGDKGHFRTGPARLDFQVDRYNPVILAGYKTALKNLVAAANPGAGAAPQDLRAKNSALMRHLMLDSADGYKGGYSISNIDISRVNPDSGETEQTTIAKLSNTFSMDKIDNNNANLGLTFHHDGLEAAHMPKGYDDILPSTSNIGIILRNVPVRQLSDLAANTMEGAIQQPEIAQMAALSAMMKGPAIMGQAGTTMEIRDNYIAGKDYRFDVNGALKADVSAVNSVAGQIHGVFSGLDPLLAKIKALASDPRQPVPEMNFWASTLEMLKKNAVVKPGTAKNPVYILDFALLPQGQIMLNEKPFSFGRAVAGSAPVPKVEKPQLVKPQTVKPLVVEPLGTR